VGKATIRFHSGLLSFNCSKKTEANAADHWRVNHGTVLEVGDNGFFARDPDEKRTILATLLLISILTYDAWNGLLREDNF
jgi:hypothetical protein